MGYINSLQDFAERRRFIRDQMRSELAKLRDEREREEEVFERRWNHRISHAQAEYQRRLDIVDEEEAIYRRHQRQKQFERRMWHYEHTPWRKIVNGEVDW